ncbi:hypothetical protein MA16_Dca000872 [Dendrobium catenatum]|uniref:Uncharacterized protein n=1 Tax=Dendrobium catenatum TaxID=906689 RepID=A0A2I0WV32_9ASPA|nr:hypothetical protein MA16_Dca000872 [Dendrobium catenatum]
MIPDNATHTSFGNLNRTISIQFNKRFIGLNPFHSTLPIDTNSNIMNPKVLSQELAVRKVLKRNKVDSNQL